MIHYQQSRAFNAASCCQYLLHLVGNVFHAPSGSSCPTRGCCDQHHRIEASSSKPYLCAQYFGRFQAGGVQNLPIFPRPSPATADFASAKVIANGFGPECNAVFIRWSITAFADCTIYIPTHGSLSCIANSLKPKTSLPTQHARGKSRYSNVPGNRAILVPNT